MRLESSLEKSFQVVLDDVPDLDGRQSEFDAQRYNSVKYCIPFTATSFLAANCSPPTPVADLDRYTGEVNNLHSNVVAAINTTPPGSLLMGTFARAANALAGYLQTIPTQFCIGSTNQVAFDRLNATVSGAVATANRGVAIFEGNLERFVNQAVPLLNSLYNLANGINSSSRDFRQVLAAAQNYDNFVKQVQTDIWNLSQRIKNLVAQLDQAVNPAINAFKRAIEQIESNVEAESQRFADRQKDTESAFRHWDTVDGKQGYERYVVILRELVQTMIPAMNEFLGKVPNTARIKAAATKCQQCINQIETGFKSFPTFQRLPADSAAFPHNRYGSEDRKYGGAETIAAVKSTAVAYHNRTGTRLYVGDMQYEHGGKMGIHKSHRKGIDADVDGVEIGDVPNHDAGLALSLAKEILSAGARLVFYASQTTVNDANTWAAQNSIAGRLQYEANHTKHFHLRVPE